MQLVPVRCCLRGPAAADTLVIPLTAPKSVAPCTSLRSSLVTTRVSCVDCRLAALTTPLPAAAGSDTEGPATIVKAQRGGQTTFHGPGQLVGYPIIDLKRRKLGARAYIEHLEKAMGASLQEGWGLASSCQPHTGVWVGDAKICAIGVQVSRGVTFHGFALNCHTSLEWFDRIVPCGIVDKSVTSLSAEVGRQVSLGEAEAAVLPSFGEVLGYSLHDVVGDAAEVLRDHNSGRR